MSDSPSDALTNFLNSLEEALDYAIEVPSPHFEHTLDIEEGFDASHSPPLPSVIEADSKGKVTNTSMVSHPPASFLCPGSLPEKESSVESMDSSNSSLASKTSVGDIIQKFCSSSSQTPDFPYHQSFDWFKQKYPEMLYPTVFQPRLQSGRAFSLSQLDQIDDQTLENYQSVDASCFPIPAGFWAEMGRVDSALNSHFKCLEEFLPNEEWVHRRVCEVCPPKVVLRRYPHFSSTTIFFLISILLPFFFIYKLII